jgi:hypothetical protein
MVADYRIRDVSGAVLYSTIFSACPAQMAFGKTAQRRGFRQFGESQTCAGRDDADAQRLGQFPFLVGDGMKTLFGCFHDRQMLAECRVGIRLQADCIGVFAEKHHGNPCRFSGDGLFGGCGF